jgi:hypothetical protein
MLLQAQNHRRIRLMICRQFKCVFIHIPKTAGQSIEQFFMNRLELDWNKDRETLHLQSNDDPSLGTEKLAHLSAAEYVQCGHMTQQDFSDYFTFSFVRNPWTRILSEYRYRNYFQHRNFKDFVLNKIPPPGLDDKYRHVMPQYDMLYDKQGNLLVDFVGRFESLQQDFDRVCEKIGLENSGLPHRNRSDKKSRDVKRKIRNLVFMNGENGHRELNDFYDDETRDAVAKYYKTDIETFDYRFDE